MSEVFNQYAAAFANKEEPFLTYHDILPDKSLSPTTFTRGEFWTLALKAAGLLSRRGITKGDKVLHVFSGNRYQDLAFRLAGCMLGSVPVTVNWQADDAEKVTYKATTTEAKLAIVDNETSVEYIEALASCESIFNSAEVEAEEPIDESAFCTDLSLDDCKKIIFTSGTTGMPKGCESSFRAFACNRATFENFLQLEDPATPATFVIINPLHHTNSSAISDWALRRPGCTMHLCLRYSTAHWDLLQSITTAASPEERVICPMVARHFDFLESLIEGGTLDGDNMKACLGKAEPLIGSAPVGPTTVERLLKYGGRLPHVRFGSTETCLQVVGTPLTHSPEEKLAVFKAGWDHSYNDQPQTGYYIGRDHRPHTEAKIVKSVVRDNEDYMVECATGEPGLLICKGDNVFTRYVANPEATTKAMRDDWYVAFGDVCFALKDADGVSDNIYWQSRDSAMLIRGGSNYAYEQLQSELHGWISSTYGLEGGEFQVAVVGVNLVSEHEDECYLTVELQSEGALAKKAEIESSLMKAAKDKKTGVSKAACPQHLRVGEIPKNFKGAILYGDLKKVSLEHHALVSSEANGTC